MPPPPDISASADADPTLGVLLRRRRNLRKKLDKVARLEGAESTGKELNEDQIAILEAGPATRIAAAEVDTLIEAVTQALSEAASKKPSRPPPAPAAPVGPPAPTTPPAAGAGDAAATENGGPKQPKDGVDGGAVDVDEAVASALKKVLEVVYFGEMFSGNGFCAAMERRAILSYEEFAEGPEGVSVRSVLTTEDLDNLCHFADRLSTRPRDRAMSHKQALEQCLDTAMQLLGRGQLPGGEKPDEQAEAMEGIVSKIRRSQYFIVEPIIQTMRESVPSPAMAPPAPQPDISFMTESNILPADSAGGNGMSNNGIMAPSMPGAEQHVESGAQGGGGGTGGTGVMDYIMPRPSQQPIPSDKADAPHKDNSETVPFRPAGETEPKAAHAPNNGYAGAANKQPGNTGPWRGGGSRRGGFGGRRGGGRYIPRGKPQV